MKKKLLAILNNSLDIVTINKTNSKQGERNMPRTSTKPKRNIWKDTTTAYGTYEGEPGNPESWKRKFDETASSKEEALRLLNSKSSVSPYDVLGLEKCATKEQIKQAWLKLVLVNHPDKGGDREKFDQIMAAYSILSI